MLAGKVSGLTALMHLAAKGLHANRQQHLNWELFDYSPLNSANFYWRISHGLRSANAIESSSRPAFYKPEQHLCA